MLRYSCVSFQPGFNKALCSNKCMFVLLSRYIFSILLWTARYSSIFMKSVMVFSITEMERVKYGLFLQWEGFCIRYYFSKISNFNSEIQGAVGFKEKWNNEKQTWLSKLVVRHRHQLFSRFWNCLLLYTVASYI